MTATIPVGSSLERVAVDTATHTAYVTNVGDNTVSVISAAPVPLVTVTSSQDPSTFGQKVTFTATIAPADGGTLTFSSGSTVLCAAVPLTHSGGSTYKAKCAATALSAGFNTITAAYPGDTGYAASADTQTVARASTALTMSFTTAHKELTLTAHLTASGSPLSGQPVSFTTGSTQLCAPGTSASGVATCTLTSAQTLLAENDHDPILASYPGDASYRPSSAATLTPPSAARRQANRPVSR